MAKTIATLAHEWVAADMTNHIGLKVRAEARSWWAYKGDIRAQRRSVRGTIDTIRQLIRNRGWIDIGRGGVTVHFAPGSKVQTYGDGEPYTSAAIKAGVLVIDSRPVTDWPALVHYSVSGPMAGWPQDIARDAAQRNGAEPGPFSYVSPYDRAKAAALIGATVHNMEPAQ